MPACLLPGLPLPVSLWLDVPGAPVPVCVTTAARDPNEVPAVLAPAIVFDREELAALVVGVENDRVWRKELLGLCFEKWRRPALRISARDTLAGAAPDADAPRWSLQHVLDRLDVKLVRVELTEPTRAVPGLPRAA